MNDFFTLITLVGSLVVLYSHRSCLRKNDWIAAITTGAAVGIGMLFATLYRPFPFLGIISSNAGQALVRGLGTTIMMLGGLVVMRMGGPVQFFAANSEWKTSGRRVLLGLAIGAPLAVINVFANQFTQGRPIAWQNPLAAALDALQPGIVEEVVYRFAFLGLLWLLLRKPLPKQASWLAGLLALLVHTSIHFDQLFLQNPLAALGMGIVMGVLWGLPLTILALRRGLDSAISFHWLQDFTRFWAGF